MIFERPVHSPGIQLYRSEGMDVQGGVALEVDVAWFGGTASRGGTFVRPTVDFQASLPLRKVVYGLGEMLGYTSQCGGHCGRGQKFPDQAAIPRAPDSDRLTPRGAFATVLDRHVPRLM